MRCQSLILKPHFENVGNMLNTLLKRQQQQNSDANLTTALVQSIKSGIFPSNIAKSSNPCFTFGVRALCCQEQSLAAGL